jgi:hypothetical protein
MASHHQQPRDVWAEINARPSTLRPFGSALRDGPGAIVERCPRIGRTVKPRAAGPCKVCGERRFFCDCEEEL